MSEKKTRHRRSANKFDQELMESYRYMVLGGSWRIPISSCFNWWDKRNEWYAGVPPFCRNGNYLKLWSVYGHLERGNPTLAIQFPSTQTQYFDIDLDRHPGQQQHLERLLEIFGPQADHLRLLYRKPSGGLSLLGRLVYPLQLEPFVPAPNYPIDELHSVLKEICQAAGIENPEIFPSRTKQRRLPFQGGPDGHILVEPENYLAKWGGEIEEFHGEDDDVFWRAIGEALVRSNVGVVIHPGDRNEQLRAFIDAPPIRLDEVLKSLRTKAAAVAAGTAPTEPVVPQERRSAPERGAPAVGETSEGGSHPGGSTKKVVRRPSTATRPTGRRGRQRAEADKLWREGLVAPNTRNDSVLALATDCFYRGLSEEQAVEKICGWFEDGKTNGFSKDYRRNPKGTLAKVPGAVKWAYERQLTKGGHPTSKNKLEPEALTLAEVKWLVEGLIRHGLNPKKTGDLHTMTWCYEFYQLAKPQIMESFRVVPNGEFVVATVRISAVRLRKLKFGSGMRYKQHIDKLDHFIRWEGNYRPATASQTGLPSRYGVTFKRSTAPKDRLIPCWMPFKQVLKQLG